MKNSIIQRTHRIAAAFLTMLCVFSICTISVFATYDVNQRKTVRVGFFAMDGYHIIDENDDGNYKGYGYDVLALMNRYWDVKYDFVGYGKSWDDMLAMLDNGEIDMVTSARMTPEREEKFDFSKPIGSSQCMITVRWDNNSIIAQDYNTYEGMRVALMKGSTRNDIFTEFAHEKNFSYIPVYFDNSFDMENALQAGQVDAIVSSSMRATKNEHLVELFSVDNFYAIVKKGNTELLNEINYAIDQMNAAEGDWKTEIFNRYYVKENSRNLELTDEEKAVIAQYSTDKTALNILCDPTRYPYSYYENGKWKGILPDYFRKLAKNIGISYHFWSLEDRDDYIAHQTYPDLGISLDARDVGSAIREKHNWAFSAPYITMRMAMVTRRDFNGTINKVATVKQKLVSSLDETYAKHAEKIIYDTRDEAMPDGTIEDISGKYTSYQPKDITVWMLIQSHPFIFIGTLLLFAAAILGFLINNARTQKRLARIAAQQAEEMKNWADKLDSANKAKTVFLANMSHDIRTPMNAIVGITKLMEHDKNDPQKLDSYIHKVQTSSRHLLSLINDVLDMSKIESGEVTMNRESVSIAEEVGQVDSIIRPQIEERNQNFTIRVHKIVHEYLIGDAMRIRQIYINLLSNAVKYTQNGGNIEMDIEELPGTDDNHALIRTTVTDNGCGMTEELVEHIFEPFTRAENSTTNKVQGTGLGMAITKNIVDLMGGTITVQSEFGKGSRFEVTIPLLIDKDTRYEIDARSVLLIGTEEMLIQNVTASFRNSGIPLYVARTKAETEELLAKKSVDTILLAGHIHDKNLHDIVALLHKETKDAVLVFCVDYEQREQAAVILKESGVDGLIARPFFLANFAGVVNEIRGNTTTKKTEEGTMLKGLKFLCAEDNALNAEILNALLDMQGASCVIYPDGEKLLEAFKQVKPGDFDAILMDVQMPIMNGLDATRAIRSSENPLGKTIPIIAMTANAFSSDVQDCLNAGMDAHVAKPLEISALERALNSTGNFSGGGTTLRI